MDELCTLRGVTQVALTGAAAVCLAFLVRFHLRWAAVRKRLSGLYRSPGSLPFIGHALQLAAAPPWDVMHGWLRTSKQRMVRMDFLGKTAVIIYHPDDMRHVLNTKQRNFPKDIDLSYKPFMDLLGTGLVTSEGALWRKQRNLLSHSLRIDILEETVPVAKRAVDRLSVKLEKIRGTGETIEMAEEFRVLTLQVIGELILSLSPEESATVFPDLYLPIVEEANQRIWEPWRAYLPTPGLFKYNRTVRALNSYLVALIRRRWDERQRLVAEGNVDNSKDILERILADIDPATFDESTVRQLRDEIKTFILAGHETSAAMMTWAVYELARHPDCLNKAKEEARAVFGGDGAVKGLAAPACFEQLPLPPHKTLNNLTYTMNMLKETLRLYSLVPVVSRICSNDDKLGDVDIPAHTKVLLHIKATHHDPKLWPEPEAFKPERFEKPFDPYAFLPFIGGPRNCLGQHLALLESRIVMALLLLRFNFTPASDNAGEQHPSLVPLCPRHGMHMRID